MLFMQLKKKLGFAMLLLMKIMNFIQKYLHINVIMIIVILLLDLEIIIMK